MVVGNWEEEEEEKEEKSKERQSGGRKTGLILSGLIPFEFRHALYNPGVEMKQDKYWLIRTNP